MSKAREWKARRLSAGVREDRPTALAFALKRGFRENGPRSHMSRLEVDQVNLDGYAGLAERLAASGIRVTRLAELNLDDGLFLRSLHAMHIAAAQDEPTAERLDASFEVWWHGTLHQAGVSPETVWVAFSGGSPIGLTALQLRGGAGTAFGLAVDREFRGRGVARLLKLHQIEWARDHGLHYLFTGNSADNPRMYDINLRLGFEPLPAVIHLTREMGGPE
jgi:GNAT superfamily N-acetyltransferase